MAGLACSWGRGQQHTSCPTRSARSGLQAAHIFIIGYLIVYYRLAINLKQWRSIWWQESEEMPLGAQRQLQSDPTPPVGSQYSCQPTVKLHILSLVWIFTSWKGVVRGRRGQQLGFALAGTKSYVANSHKNKFKIHFSAFSPKRSLKFTSAHFYRFFTRQCTGTATKSMVTKGTRPTPAASAILIMFGIHCARRDTKRACSNGFM